TRILLSRYRPHPQSTLFPYTTLFRSTEKITISAAPKPGQTVHYTATQELALEVTPDVPPDAPAGSASPLPTMKVAGKTRLAFTRSEEHTSELQSRSDLVCRLLLEKKK